MPKLPAIDPRYGMPTSYGYLLDRLGWLRADIARVFDGAEELGVPEKALDAFDGVRRTLREIESLAFDLSIPLSAMIQGTFYVDPRLQRQAREATDADMRALSEQVSVLGATVEPAVEDAAEMCHAAGVRGLPGGLDEDAHGVTLKSALLARHVAAILDERAEGRGNGRS